MKSRPNGFVSCGLVTEPEVCRDFALHHSDRGRADAALEAAGAVDTLRLPWECVRPKVVVTAVAFYDRPQTLLLADMYGKNLTFCIGGMDGCDCARSDRARSTPCRSLRTAFH